MDETNQKGKGKIPRAVPDSPGDLIPSLGVTLERQGRTSFLAQTRQRAPVKQTVPSTLQTLEELQTKFAGEKQNLNAQGRDIDPTAEPC
jgi:hypothetical protein